MTDHTKTIEALTLEIDRLNGVINNAHMIAHHASKDHKLRSNAYRQFNRIMKALSTITTGEEKCSAEKKSY